jgi:hypothetical protein
MNFWIIWEEMPLKSPNPTFVDIFFTKAKAEKDCEWYAAKEPDATYVVKEYKV